MIRFLFLCMLTGAGVLGVAAQDNQDNIVSRFIASTDNDSLIIAQSKHASIVRKHSYFTPFVSDMELRIRNRAWDIKGQRYTVRLEPRGFGETRAIWNYNSSQIAYEEDRNKHMVNDKLLYRYIYLIDCLERKMFVSSYQDLITLYEDRIKVMDQMKNSTDFDLNDLIEAEKDLSKLMVQHLEQTQEVQAVYETIRSTLSLDKLEDLDTNGLVTVGTIKKIVTDQQWDLNENNATLRYMKRQFELASSRFEYEKAQQRKLISFVEFSYDNGTMIDEMERRDERKTYDLNQAFIVELGVKIPFLSGGQEDLARRKLAFMKDEEEYSKVRKELLQKMKKDTADIRALISEFEFLTARETEVDAEASLKKYLQMSGVNPLALLSIKENLIKNYIEKSLVYYSILRNFIYVLDVTGEMSKRPLRNFLLENQEIIEK